MNNSRINKRYRKDKLFTTVKIGSVQEVTDEGVGALIVEGGAVIKKGIAVGLNDVAVAGTINYCDGNFFGYDECERIVKFGQSCECTKVELEGYSSLCPDIPDQTLCVDATFKLTSDCLEIWGTVNHKFRGIGRIMLPFNINPALPMCASIHYSRECSQVDNSEDCCDKPRVNCITDIIPTANNFCKPLVYDKCTCTFAFYLEDLSVGDVFIYQWCIKASVCEGELAQFGSD